LDSKDVSFIGFTWGVRCGLEQKKNGPIIIRANNNNKRGERIGDRLISDDFFFSEMGMGKL
jgi:hypothetical protein